MSWKTQRHQLRFTSTYAHLLPRLATKDGGSLAADGVRAHGSVGEEPDNN
jgi:hypothetical protein